MPTPTKQQLKDELTNDPDGLGYTQYVGVQANGKPDVQSGKLLELLKTRSQSRTKRIQPVQRRHVKNVLIFCQCLSTLMSGTGPWAKTAQLLFNDPDFPIIDTDDAVWLGLVNGLLGEGMVTQEAVDMIAGLADIPGASREEDLWGTDSAVTEDDILSALRS